MNNLSELKKYDFHYAGEIFTDLNDNLNYKITTEQFKQKDEQIYAWVIDDQVVYIGMASKGVHKRLSEHRGGWRGGSTTGIKKSTSIREQLCLNKKVYVYGRTCKYVTQTVDVLGQEVDLKISLVTQEEDALIRLFKPAWNVVGK